MCLFDFIDGMPSIYNYYVIFRIYELIKMTFTATTVDAGNATELKTFNDAISYNAYANG